MRQPVFLGLREDIAPADVRREKPENASLGAGPAGRRRGASRKRKGRLVAINDVKVDLTNLDKVLWPDEGYTKGDVIAYYRSVAPFILPYLKDRPESLHRHPDGIDAPGFFQKNVDHAVPGWVETLRDHSGPERQGSRLPLVPGRGRPRLHGQPRLHRDQPMAQPDRPPRQPRLYGPRSRPARRPVRRGSEVRPRHPRRAHGDRRARFLQDIGRHGPPRVRASRGPIHPRPGDAVRPARQPPRKPAPARQHEHRERCRKNERERSIWTSSRTAGGQTLAAAYCLRPRKGAPVSTPLAWEEVDDSLDPRRFTIETTAGRLQQVGDLWKDVLGPGIDMEQCLSRLDDMLEKKR